MQWNAVYSLKKIVSVSGKLLVDDLTILKKKRMEVPKIKV
jgi:hypothetical protein